MFSNATASEVDIRWKRNCVSRGSCVTPEILLPSSVMNSCVTPEILLPSSVMNFKANSFQAPPVSIAIGTKWCVLSRSVYFVRFVFRRSVCRCCRSRRCIANIRVRKRIWDGHVPSQRLASRSWIMIAPSGLFPSDRDKPTGSLTARYCAFLMDLQMISFICACLICRGALLLHDKP